MQTALFKNKSNAVNSILIALLASITFMNFWPLDPYPTWLIESITLIISLLLCSTIHSSRIVRIGPIQITLALLLIIAGINHIVFRPAYPSISFITIIYLAVALLVSHHIYQVNNKKELILLYLAYGLLAGGAIQMTVGLLQMSGVAAIYWNWIDPSNIWALRLADTDRAPLGLILQRNNLADYLFISAAASCYLHAHKKISTIYWLAFILAVASFLALSMSRSVVIYIGVTAIILLHTNKKDDLTRQLVKNTYLFLLLSILLQIFFPIIKPYLTDLLPFIKEGSGIERLSRNGLNDVRWIEWKKAWYVFTQNPILGAGIGTFDVQSDALKEKFPTSLAPATIFTHCHNIFLQLAAEMGIGAVLAFIFGLMFTLYALIKNKLDSHHAFISIVLVTIMIHSQLEFPLWYAYFLILFTVTASLIKYDIYSFATRINHNKSIKSIAIYATIGMVILTIFWNGQVSKIMHAYQTNKQTSNDTQAIWKLTTNPLFSDIADFALILTAPLNTQNIDYKLHISKNYLSSRPEIAVKFRYSVYLCLNNQFEEGKSEFQKLIKNHPEDKNYIAQSIDSIALPTQCEEMKILAKQN